MADQIISYDEIQRAARRCWDASEPCPYPAGSAAHDVWARAYAACAALNVAEVLVGKSDVLKSSWSYGSISGPKT